MITKSYLRVKQLAVLPAIIFWSLIVSAQQPTQVPNEHPRLLGSREHLQEMAKERTEAYQRVVTVAKDENARGGTKMISQALVSAIENDAEMGKKAVVQAMEIIRGPIRKGHVRFGNDLAYTALVYDLCFPYWEASEKLLYHQYMNNTIDANVGSETAVFHNGWYGYKNWGIGISCYATWYENERAPAYLQTLEKDYRERTAPALELAGNGGGWGEGFYVNYFLDEWLFFCEVAKIAADWTITRLPPVFIRTVL